MVVTLEIILVTPFATLVALIVIILVEESAILLSMKQLIILNA